MNIKKNILETIGHTPLVQLNHNLYAKVESFNPGGSVKDRVAFSMLSKALEEKIINKDSVIIEPTSGNTGVGLAMVCAALHLKCMIVMPDTMSTERRKLIQAYGAQLVLTDGNLGMKGAIEKAESLQKEISNSFIPMQFENKNNPLAHYMTTGNEIYNDLNEVDIFVAGIGTGGTISGVGKRLKELKKDVRIVGVEPEASAVITKGIAGKHKIQGIGAGFIPKNYDLEIVDVVYTIEDEKAYSGTRELAREYGILAGISSGAVFEIAKKVVIENPDKNVVVLLPDTGERYLSSDVFD